jgi:hypothetical protein
MRCKLIRSTRDKPRLRLGLVLFPDPPELDDDWFPSPRYPGEGG